jgi:hypothetical protein
MKYFKDKNNTVYAYPIDGSQDHFIKDKMSITKDVADELGKQKADNEFNSMDYYRKRIFSYPEIGEFLDAWVKNDQKALEEYRKKCLDIKTKFPKPEGF